MNDTITPAVGEITHLSGRILSSSGEPVRNALVEIWQVDAKGTYIHSNSSYENQDTNFQGFGSFLTGSLGEYYFRTIKPTKYVERAPHIHYAVYQGRTRMLTTQLYVKGDPRNQQDFLFVEAKTPQAPALIVTDFTPILNSKIGALAAKWDIILGTTPENPKDSAHSRGFQQG